MIYNFKENNQEEKEKARIYLEKLIKDGKMCRLEEEKPLRSNSQNKYLHVLFSLFGIEYGLTIDESKEAIKEALGYKYKKRGKMFFCKTSKMDSGELTIFIDKFRKFASEHGCYLPSADEYNGKMDYYINEIERYKKYL